MTAEQAKASLTEKPKYLVEDVALKIQALDREIKYLVNKAKIYRPKTKAKVKDAVNKTENATNDTKPIPGKFWMLNFSQKTLIILF